jgi:hypothetical protein
MATFEFQNPSSSAYFVIEIITTSSIYPEGTPKYMEGTWDVNGIGSLAAAFADMTLVSESYALNGSGSISINTINFVFTGSAQTPSNTNDIIYLNINNFVDTTIAGFLGEFNTTYITYQPTPPYDTFLIGIDLDPSSYSPNAYIYYVGNDQAYGNTIPYAVNGVGGILSGGSNYSFGLVTSSFIAGVVVQPGYSAFNFTPNITIPVGAIEFRGTGEYTVTITP